MAARTKNRRRKARRRPKVISLFTGAGGLDLGLEAAGFETAIAVEMDAHACATLRANRDWPVFESDIHDVSSAALLEAAKLQVGEADLLVGGPPCQPFSKSSYWARGDALRLDDPRADTLTAYLRVLRDTQPRAFILENVYGLAYKGKDEGLRLLLDATDQINKQIGTSYRISWRVLQAADYGVPQLRERVFLVGHREGKSFNFPAPKFSAQQRIAESAQVSLLPTEPYRTAWDAFGDLDDPRDENLRVGGKWGDLLPSIPEGENYLFHTPRKPGVSLFGWRTRYWSFLLKLAKNRPSWTVQAQPGSAIGPFHWNSRKLSIRELCRLQTFPDDYEIVGGRTAAQRLLGNAVPSLMGEVLGHEVRRQLLDGKRVTRPPKLLPPRRLPVPRPERPAPVPKKYRHLEGNHKAHPGTGKGRGAKQAAVAAEAAG